MRAGGRACLPSEGRGPSKARWVPPPASGSLKEGSPGARPEGISLPRTPPLAPRASIHSPFLRRVGRWATPLCSAAQVELRPPPDRPFACRSCGPEAPEAERAAWGTALAARARAEEGGGGGHSQQAQGGQLAQLAGDLANASGPFELPARAIRPLPSADGGRPERAGPSLDLAHGSFDPPAPIPRSRSRSVCRAGRTEAARGAVRGAGAPRTDPQGRRSRGEVTKGDSQDGGRAGRRARGGRLANDGRATRKGGGRGGR